MHGSKHQNQGHDNDRLLKAGSGPEKYDDGTLYPNPLFRSLSSNNNLTRFKVIEFASVLYKIADVVSCSIRSRRTFYSIEEIWLIEDSGTVYFVCTKFQSRINVITKNSINPVPKGTMVSMADADGFIESYQAYCVESSKKLEVYELIPACYRIHDHHIYTTWNQGNIILINKINHLICETSLFQKERAKMFGNKLNITSVRKSSK